MTPTTLTAADLTERAHLQEWVLQHPAVLGEDVLIITSEYDRWVGADGARAARRLDVLGLDRSGQLVVVELKRDDAPGDVHLQAITYAALVSRFDLGSLSAVLAAFNSKRGQDTSEQTARELILEHVGGELDADVLRSPRIVLVAGRFPREVTHTAVWLTERSLDVRLIEVSAWTNGQQVLVGFQQLWPVPGLDTFTLEPVRSESAAVSEKVAERSRAGTAIRRLVDAGALQEGAVLRIDPQHGVPAGVRPAVRDWLEADPARSQVTWTNDSGQPLSWAVDGSTWRPTTLARHIFEQATARRSTPYAAPRGSLLLTVRRSPSSLTA